jgi:hypothetical protein
MTVENQGRSKTFDDWRQNEGKDATAAIDGIRVTLIGVAFLSAIFGTATGIGQGIYSYVAEEPFFNETGWGDAAAISLTLSTLASLSLLLGWNVMNKEAERELTEKYKFWQRYG